jgi:hypothetical protein
MASLSKSKVLFGFTSPRTIEKSIPEIQILVENFTGQLWNQNTQIDFFELLFSSEHYNGDKMPTNVPLAARDRITRSPKSLGFVNLKPLIELTKAGEALLKGKRIHEVFTRQLLKFQLPSPYHTQSKHIAFNVKPYLELLRFISVLEPVSKTEIALFFTQITDFNNFDEIINKVKRFRTNATKFKGSRKLYVHECFEEEVLEIYNAEIKKGETETRESSDTSVQKFIRTKKSNMLDYADAFIRYLRSTTLITFQKKTYRLVISPSKRYDVDFILGNISRLPLKYKNLKDFQTYLFDDENIQLYSDDKLRLKNRLNNLGTLFPKELSIDNLKDLVEKTEKELLQKVITDTQKKLKTYKEYDDIIDVYNNIKKKIVPDPPLYLEWNTWRAMTMLNYAKEVKGNFILDLDGVPLNTAPGNRPDIEIVYENFNLIIEVTMSSGNTQYRMENESVPRHFGKIKQESNKETYCLFIAPKISDGALAHFFNLNRINTRFYGGKTKIIPLSLDMFIKFIETGKNNKFDSPKIFQNFLETIWENNQEIEDEIIWQESIYDRIPTWVS